MATYGEFKRLGQSLWLDNLSRTLLKEGGLARYVRTGVSGVTSNPTIFHKAVAESPYYREELGRLRLVEPDLERRYEALIVEDIRAACDLLKPVHDASAGDDGYVSLEVAPHLAHDTTATVTEAKRLSRLVAHDNLLIKIPATPAGVAAFEQLIAEGYRVNVTLLFSTSQTERVFEAYLRGAQSWLARGGDPKRPKAVASLFLSRVDTLADKRLDQFGDPDALALRGKTAVAMAKLAYGRYKTLFHAPAFAEFRQAGLRPQYLLWASTGTKNPAYSDLLYVEPLIGPETINTLPDKTLAALTDHGQAEATLEHGLTEAEAHMQKLLALGIDPQQLGEELQTEGLRLFSESFEQMVELMR